MPVIADWKVNDDQKKSIKHVSVLVLYKEGLLFESLDAGEKAVCGFCGIIIMSE